MKLCRMNFNFFESIVGKFKLIHDERVDSKISVSTISV